MSNKIDIKESDALLKTTRSVRLRLDFEKVVPDEVINPHPRFGALTKNIRERRGSNVEVIAPLFQDDQT